MPIVNHLLESSLALLKIGDEGVDQNFSDIIIILNIKDGTSIDDNTRIPGVARKSLHSLIRKSLILTNHDETWGLFLIAI